MHAIQDNCAAVDGRSVMRPQIGVPRGGSRVRGCMTNWCGIVSPPGTHTPITRMVGDTICRGCALCGHCPATPATMRAEIYARYAVHSRVTGILSLTSNGRSVSQCSELPRSGLRCVLHGRSRSARVNHNTHTAARTYTQAHQLTRPGSILRGVQIYSLAPMWWIRRHAVASGLYPLSQHPINSNRVGAVPLVLDPQLLSWR